MLLFLWHTTNGGCVCFRYKLCHLNMKYCLGTITCIDLSNIKTNTQHTPHTLHLFWRVEKNHAEKTHRLTFKAYQSFFHLCSIFFSSLLFLLFPSVFSSHMVVAVFCFAFYHLSMFYDSIYIARGILPRVHAQAFMMYGLWYVKTKS